VSSTVMTRAKDHRRGRQWHGNGSRRWMAAVGWGNGAAQRPGWGEWAVAAVGRPAGPGVELHLAMGKGQKEKGHGPTLRIRPKRLLGIEIPFYFSWFIFKIKSNINSNNF
jgi:hypothetical protein